MPLGFIQIALLGVGDFFGRIMHEMDCLSAKWPNRWFEEIKARPATVPAYQRAKEINTEPTVSSEEARRILFGQTAAVVKS
jgi:hypothetical protein